jgi:predicted aspartyl protease
VDGALRALLDVSIRRTKSEPPTVVTVWVDTAFNGFLVFPQEMMKNSASNKRLLLRPFWQMVAL